MPSSEIIRHGLTKICGVLTSQSEGRLYWALLDEAAVIACMVYVDLNPVRASMANTPEASDYTSIKARISDPDKEKQLLPLVGSKTFNPETPCPTTTLSFGWADYLELVDWTGRSIRDDKTGERQRRRRSAGILVWHLPSL